MVTIFKLVNKWSNTPSSLASGGFKEEDILSKWHTRMDLGPYNSFHIMNDGCDHFSFS
jgi:hypothetical protein